MQVPAGSGALQDSSRTLYELAGDDWDYNTYSEPAAFSLSTMRDTSGMGSMQGLPPAASSHARRSSWSKALMARFEAEKRRAQDPAYRAKLQAAAATPLKVVIMSGLFWEMNENSTKGCSVDGVPLDCRFTTNQGDVSHGSPTSSSCRQAAFSGMCWRWCCCVRSMQRWLSSVQRVHVACVAAIAETANSNLQCSMPWGAKASQLHYSSRGWS